MQRNLKILLLYASFGNGHLQVSHALERGFKQKGFSMVTKTDLFAEAYPLINQITKFLYIKSFTLFPGVYGWLYYRTKNMRHTSLLSRWFHSFGVQKLRLIVEQENPDVIINTFPMLAIAELKKKTGLKLPTYTVLTDFDLHNRWVHDEINKFYVASNDLKHQIASFGIPDHRIEVSGIPLNEAFEKPEKDAHLVNKTRPFTVLILAGCFGVMPHVKKICKQLLSLEDIQIVVVCGKNQSLLNEMKRAFEDYPRMIVYGFTDHIHQFMAEATCIITKPGGITVSEAISFHLPMLLFRPVPGQERENAHYLAQKGAARIATNTEQLIKQLFSLLNHPTELELMQKAVGGLKVPHATENIVNDILQDLQLQG